MDHILKALATHWHLNTAHYVQLRLLCAMSLVPLLATLYLILFGKRKAIGPGAVQIKRHIITLTRRPAGRGPVQLRVPTAE
jgi:hypothetical protein